MKKELSELDKKILYELDQEGRESFARIAKTIGTTTQVVKYHYDKLIDSGVIKHFWAFVDYDKAGYSFFWGYWLKFSGLTKEAEEEMYADFKTNGHIPIVMRCDGYADALLGIIGKDISHHNKVLEDVFAKYGKYITMSDIVVGLGFIKFPRSYLIGKENKVGSFVVSGSTEKIKNLSEVDKKIISLLQEDGRMDFTQIAKILGVSVGLVHKHYYNLVEKGVITKITYTLDYEKIGMVFYRVLFKIIQYNKEEIDRLYKFCELHPNIINYVKVMGDWQLILDVEIESRDKLRDMLRQIKNDFRSIVYQIEINEIYKIDKFTQMAVEYPELGKPKQHTYPIPNIEK
jgi:Lrp/AsnC family transcriptional regulator for asnA, asnC and gidA